MSSAEKTTVQKEDAVEARLHVYELGYHLVPTLDDSALEAAVSSIRNSIEKVGGSFVAEGASQRMTLAQPMAVWNNGRWIKYDQSYFGWIKFELASDNIAAVEKALKESKEILRSIVFQTVREDMRANVRQFVLKEVKRTDTIKSGARRSVGKETSAEVSDEKIDEAIAGLVAD